MKGDNSLLIALALLERAKVQLKVDKREQLSRVGLQSVKQILTEVLSQINKSEMSDVYILGYLISSVDCIERLLEDENYLETDTETKSILTDKILSCLDVMYINVGKYYETRNFDYTMKLTPLLKRVVDRCIADGYYFGEMV